MLLYGFIAGILFWQVVVLAVFFISRENEELTMVTSAIVPLLICKGVYLIGRKLWVQYVRKTYKAYEIVNEDMHVRVVRLKTKWLNKYNTKPDESKFYLRELPNMIQIENAMSMKQVKKIKNGWFNQEWIDTNLKKATV